MFAAKLWLPVVLLVVAGALLLVSGTTILSERVLPPYEQMSQNAARGATGMLLEESARTLEAAAHAAANADVRAAVKQKAELSEVVKTALLSPVEGRFGAPAFALLVKSDGSVSGRAGADTAELGEQLEGLPLVAEALRGVGRDGLLMLGGKPFHAVAHPIYEGTSALGTVLLGWAYEGAFFEKLSTDLHARVALLLEKDRVGPALDDVADEQLRQITAEGSLGALKADLPLGMPVLLPNKDRWLVQRVPLYPGEKSAGVFVAVDRTAAFAAVGMAQLAVLFLTLVLGVLFAAIIGTTLRSISRPMQVIMDHLSAFQQGTAVGILPESALSGPFVRLGKQINMILQMMPSTSRSGGAPLSTLSGPSPTAGLGGPLSGPPLPPPPPKDGMDNGLRLDALLGGPAPTSSPGSDAPSLSSSPNPGSGSFPQAPGLGGPPPTSGLSNLFDDAAPDPLAAFRGPPSSGSSSSPISVSPASPSPTSNPGMARPAPPPEPPPAPMTAEATVMFQVPQELIERSTQDVLSGAGAPVKARPPSSGPGIPSMPSMPPMPPQPPPGMPPRPMMDDNRTVVAQVPQELLSQAAPRSDITAADDAHYREVYDKFVETRQECGEDVSDLTYERFVQKLLKNRQQIIEKHKARSVRFQVYVKDGKAALRALPVRE